MPRRIVAHRLKIFEVGPFARWRGSTLFQHGPHGVAQGAKLRRGRPKYMFRHNGGRGLPERTRRDILGELGDLSALKAQIDLDHRPADPADLAGGRIGTFNAIHRLQSASDFNDLV